MAVALGGRPAASQPRERRLSRGSGFTPGLLLKLLALAALDVVAFFVISDVYDANQSGLASFLVVAVVLANVVYLLPRLDGYKFLYPGIVLLALFIVWPAIYTVFISTTNYGTGHVLSQEQAVTQIESNSLAVDPDAGRLRLFVVERDDATLAWLLEDTDGTLYFGGSEGAEPIDAGEIERNEAGRVTVVDGAPTLSLLELSRMQDDVLSMVVQLPDGRQLSTVNGTQAVVKAATLEYDEAANTFTATADGTVYRAVDGTWTSDGGLTLTPGYRASIGLGNFDELVSDQAVRGAFVRIFLWNFAFAFLSVLGALAFGMFVAVALNHRTMRGLRLYRSLLIIPYAIPSFVTALVWRGMFRSGDGIFARMLPDFMELNWFGDPWLAKLAIIIVNVWLGFPYFFVVSLAFLQTVPTEIMEAARVDGATGRQVFRMITWPMLFTAMTPLLVSSFAFNFNNFNTVELLTGGDPVIRGTADAGHTDILITFAFNLATNSAEGSRFAFSAAVSTLIFIIVAGITTVAFTRSGAFKEIKP